MKADSHTEEMLRSISESLDRSDMDLGRLKLQLVELLEYLSSQVGRTHDNCVAVDSFFCLHDTWPEKELPDDYHDLMADMGGALHDAIESPEIAENFDSTPEQLLERARKLNAQPAAGALRHRNGEAQR